jgi:hypothetical protein
MRLGGRIITQATVARLWRFFRPVRPAIDGTGVFPKPPARVIGWQCCAELARMPIFLPNEMLSDFHLSFRNRLVKLYALHTWRIERKVRPQKKNLPHRQCGRKRRRITSMALPTARPIISDSLTCFADRRFPVCV